MSDLSMFWLESMAWANFMSSAFHTSEGIEETMPASPAEVGPTAPQNIASRSDQPTPETIQVGPVGASSSTIDSSHSVTSTSRGIEEATPAGPVESAAPVPGPSHSVPSESDDTSAGSPETMPLGPAEPSSSAPGSPPSVASWTSNLSTGTTLADPLEHSPQAVAHLSDSDEEAQAQNPPGVLTNGTVVLRSWNQVNGFARQAIRRWRPDAPPRAARPSIGATEEAQAGINLLGVSVWVYDVRGWISLSNDHG
jgi:hypothetical protein